MRNIVLVDGGVLLFRACFATAKEGDVTDYIGSYLGHVRKALEATSILVALSEGNNFRKTILPTYKANRTDAPPNMADAKAYIKDNYQTKSIDGIEADDILGILSTYDGLKGNKCIFSIDKDFEQIPGVLINPNKDSSGEGSETVYTPRKITKEEADYNFFIQVLMGDTTDNYFGIPGIGIKKAIKILGNIGQSEADLWTKVVGAYLEHGLTEEDALVQAICARILRAKDFDFDTKKPILWEPPNI